MPSWLPNGKINREFHATSLRKLFALAGMGAKPKAFSTSREAAETARDYTEPKVPKVPKAKQLKTLRQKERLDPKLLWSFHSLKLFPPTFFVLCALLLYFLGNLDIIMIYDSSFLFDFIHCLWTQKVIKKWFFFLWEKAKFLFSCVYVFCSSEGWETGLWPKGTLL